MSAFETFGEFESAGASRIKAPADIHIHPRLLKGYERKARVCIAQFDAGLLDMLKSLTDILVRQHLTEPHPFAVRLRLAVQLIDEGLCAADPISTGAMQIRASATTLIDEITACLEKLSSERRDVRPGG